MGKGREEGKGRGRESVRRIRGMLEGGDGGKESKRKE